MNISESDKVINLSIVIPCFNEDKTLESCVERVREIGDDHLKLQIIIVDDGSTDKSPQVARKLASKYGGILVLQHDANRGKGAALRSAFQKATGDFVAIQDADLEYDPKDLRRLLGPLIADEADAVIGSRFLSSGAHRVLYFWHSLGNRLLTFASNMFTDLNLTDIEAGYKVFRREVLQGIDLKEDRFGFEPEIIAEIAHMRLRIFEMGISYKGRAYAEGKKIGMKDAFRALYCIFRYNAYRAPIPVQFILYLLIGGLVATINLFVFLELLSADVGATISAPVAFIAAAVTDYLLCILFLFRHNARWNSINEILVYGGVVTVVGIFDLATTRALLEIGSSPTNSKLVAIGLALIPNFAGRRFFVFPEASSGPWRPQEDFSYDK
ncbi:MAG: glycosyltransferase [Planctomycetota bacterium]|jgi:glycosyltransferase involved in cell wall biosynthesis